MGGGVLHTKLWIIDHQHFYVGSANMDWRSLTEVSKDKVWRCPVWIMVQSVFFFCFECGMTPRS